MKKVRKGMVMATIAGILAGHIGISFAAEEPASEIFNLDQIVVSATKTERKIKDIPASVTVITAEDLHKANVKTLDDALLTVPGVYIKKQAGMKATKISIRGLSQNRVLVLMDGLPLNNGYTGGVQWANIPVENIEKIEVIRGPFSALYGSSAMGGVINIITKQNTTPQTSVTLGAGQQGTQNYEFNHNGSNGKLEYYIDFSKVETDGYIINPAIPTDGKFGTNNNQYDVKLIYHLNETDSLTVSRGRSDYEYNYEVKTDRAKRVTETTNVNYKTQLSPDKELSVHLGELNFSDYWTISGSNYSPNPAKTQEGEINLNWKASDYHTLTMGLGTKVDTCDGLTYKLANPAVITYTNLLEKSGGKTKTNSVYLQDEMKLGAKATLFIGGRYDQWEFYDGYNAVGSLSNKSANSFSPKASLLYKQNEQTSWYVSAGKSFVSPTIFQLARRWDVAATLLLPNPDLQPEKATSYEIGVNHQFDKKTSAKVAVFHNNIENMIYQGFNRSISKTKDELQWKNAGEAEITGVELELNHQFSTEWSGFINYTHNNPTITSNSDATLVGKQIPTVPKDMFNVGINYHKEKLNAQLLGRYVSRTYESDKNTEPTSGYGSFQPRFIVDTKFSYALAPKTELSLSIDNVLDRVYYNECLAAGRTVMVQLTQKF